MSAEDPIDGVLPEHQSEEAFERWLVEAEADPEHSRELDFLADLTAAAERLHLEQGAARPYRRPARRLVPWLAAAGLLAILGLTWWFVRAGAPTFSAHDLAQHSAPPYFAVDLRGPDDHSNEAFEQAMSHYARAEYVAAIAGLETWRASRPDHLPGSFYRAAALEQLGRLQEAEAEYARVGEAPSQLGEHALFRLANLCLLRDDALGARDILERLRDRNGSFRKNAEELLARLAAR